MANLFETTSDETPTHPGVKGAVGYVQVAPERAFDQTQDGLMYALPPDLADLQIGERVLIPLGRGNKLTPGIVVTTAVDPSTLPAKARIKAVAARDPKAGGALTKDLVELGQWMAAYYCAPLGMTLTSMLPAAVKHGAGMKRQTYIDFAPPGRLLYPDPTETAASKESPASAPRLSKLQQRILEVLQHAETRPVEIRDLAKRADAKTLTPIKRLLEAGWLAKQMKSSVSAVWDERPPDASAEVDRAVTLTAEQAKIVHILGDLLDDPTATTFSAHVIYGVTGSGKTEVYLRLIEKVVRSGRSAIVLVPEIALTPQTVTRFKARFEALVQSHLQTQGNNAVEWNVAVLHSGLTAAQRHQQWQLVQSGHAPIIIGARSAIFAPILPDNLGLIVVDEEHDNSYKQDQAPRYHARDVAVKRAQQAGCPVILGSATPSLETYANARLRKNYTWHEITERVPGAEFPTVEVVDLAEERKRRPRTDRYVHLLGPRLENRLHRTIAAGGDVILLLNRRGYANYIACPDQNCGWVMTCDHCDVAMVYHKKKELPRGGFVRCHHCQAEQLLPNQCPVCAKKTNTFGLGTQRIEEELIRKFPTLAAQDAILRMDSDTMHRAQDYDDALRRFRSGEVRVLVGTQMIAKGLDFPNVLLVGVINADTAINLPDFRAAERTYQLIAQVAGRSGRAEQRGHVIVQTFQPNLPAVQHAAQHDYHGFAEQEIIDRLPAALPPIGRMARIVIRDRDHLQCSRRARIIYEALEDQLEILRRTTDIFSKTAPRKPLGDDLEIAADVPPIRLRGPAPCPLSRIADHHRWSIEILSAVGPGPIQRVLTNLRNLKLAKSDAFTAIDVDPVQLL